MKRIHVLSGLLACALLLASASPALAQRFRPVRGIRPIPLVPSGFINTSWQNNPYVYWRIHHHGWPYPYPYPPYPNPYPYPYYNNNYPVYPPVPMPYGGSDSTVVHNFYTSPAGSIDPIGEPPSTAVLPAPRDNQTVVAVVLPNSLATVWVDGQRTYSTGATRVFHTPPLAPGRTYTYTVRAVWNQGGEPRSHERTVEVTPGQTSVVDFGKSASR